MSILDDLLADCVAQEPDFDWTSVRVKYYATSVQTCTDAIWSHYNMLTSLLALTTELIAEVNALNGAVFPAAAPAVASRKKKAQPTEAESVPDGSG